MSLYSLDEISLHFVDYIMMLLYLIAIIWYGLRKVLFPKLPP